MQLKVNIVDIYVTVQVIMFSYLSASDVCRKVKMCRRDIKGLKIITLFFCGPTSKIMAVKKMLSI